MKIKTTNYTSTARVNVSVVNEDKLNHPVLDAPHTARDFWHSVVAHQTDYESEKESLIVVLLNTRQLPYAWHRVSVGTINETSAHPRDILRPVICGAAYGFCLMHNHPTGDTTPSRADIALTKRIAEAADLMQLQFVDHVIVADGKQNYHSFRESGII